MFPLARVVTAKNTFVSIDTIVQWIAASSGFTLSHMTTLARYSVGRILLHLLCILRNRRIRFQAAGIMREIAPVAAAPALFARMHARLIEASVRHTESPGTAGRI